MQRFVTITWVLGCLGAFFARGEYAIQNNSQTYDEAVHLVAGVSYWKKGDFRINLETPPLAKLCWALPAVLTGASFEPDPQQWENNEKWDMATAFLYDSPTNHHDLLRPARRVNLLFGASLVLLIGWVAYRWWGVNAGRWALALAVCDPNIAAQSSLLSTDTPLTLFCVASWYAWWEYVRWPAQRTLIVLGVCLGCAMATKFSAGYALLGAIIGTTYWLARGGLFRLPNTPAGRSRWADALAMLIRLGLISIAVILPFYFVTQALEWPRGLKYQLGRGEQTDPRFYFLEQIRPGGTLIYYVVALAVKTPITTLALAFLGCWPVGRKRFARVDQAFLVLLPVIFLVGMSASKLDLGVRLVLPFYPLFFWLAARCATWFENYRYHFVWQGMIALAVLTSPLADAKSLHRPLSYFNEAVGRDQGHRYLGDSNIDWGQGLWSLQTFTREHGSPTIFLSYQGTARPEAYGIRYLRLPSWGEFTEPPAFELDRQQRIFIAVSVNSLQGTNFPNADYYAWLRARPPLTKLDGSIWVWDITDDEETIQRCLKMTIRSR